MEATPILPGLTWQGTATTTVTNHTARSIRAKIHHLSSQPTNLELNVQLLIHSTNNSGISNTQLAHNPTQFMSITFFQVTDITVFGLMSMK